MWERALMTLQPYRAVTFDLDGTLVRLKVDWMALQREMWAYARDHHGIDLEGKTVWDMLRNTEGEVHRALDDIVGRHEVLGARQAVRLPLADLLGHLRGKRIGIVSLNSRESCQVALEAAGLKSLVHCLIAREDSSALKPRPEPLLGCLRSLGASPKESVYVGDRDRDRLTALRAGVAFVGVEELLPGSPGP